MSKKSDRCCCQGLGEPVKAHRGFVAIKYLDVFAVPSITNHLGFRSEYHLDRAVFFIEGGNVHYCPNMVLL